MSTLQNVKKALKAAGLPAAFVPARSQVVAVNCNEHQVEQVAAILQSNGYRRAETYYGTDTDYQVTFRRETKTEAAMTATELTAAVAKMGARKNNTLTIGAFTLTKWSGNDRYCLTRGEQHLSVAGIAHITKLLKDNGAVAA